MNHIAPDDARMYHGKIGDGVLGKETCEDVLWSERRTNLLLGKVHNEVDNTVKSLKFIDFVNMQRSLLLVNMHLIADRQQDKAAIEKWKLILTIVQSEADVSKLTINPFHLLLNFINYKYFIKNHSNC